MEDADTPFEGASVFAPFFGFGMTDFRAPEADFLVFSVIIQSVSQTGIPLILVGFRLSPVIRKFKLTAGFANRLPRRRQRLTQKAGALQALFYDAFSKKKLLSFRYCY